MAFALSTLITITVVGLVLIIPMADVVYGVSASIILDRENDLKDEAPRSRRSKRGVIPGSPNDFDTDVEPDLIDPLTGKVSSEVLSLEDLIRKASKF